MCLFVEIVFCFTEKCVLLLCLLLLCSSVAHLIYYDMEVLLICDFCLL